MIISASYRTDIPTCHGAWFMNRLRAGYCRVVNPYNGRPGVVSLAKPDVDAIVFWTKNLAPFDHRPRLPLPQLHTHRRGAGRRGR